MSALQLRPRFRKIIDLAPVQITERLRTYSTDPQRKCYITLSGYHTTLGILPDEQHYWSPQLSLEILEEGQGTLIKGLYGPHPKVWTMFMFLYTGLGLIGLFGLLYGLVQWSLSMPPIALWIALAALILEITFYFIARSGKQLAHGQMLLLQKELNRILEKNHK